jgi:hypothetical protein
MSGKTKTCEGSWSHRTGTRCRPDVLWHEQRDHNRDIAWSSMMIVWLVGIESMGVNTIFGGS